MTMAASSRRPRLLAGALLVACTAPLGSGFMIAREDGAVDGATVSREELRAAVRGERARVSAEMRKAGLAPRRLGLEDWPFDERPWNWLTGTYVNCLQTLSIATDPVWSMIEGIGAVNASCSNGQFDTMPCKEASLGMTETSLGALGWFLDFPTDCLGYTCAFNSPTDPTRMHPNIRTLVIGSAFNDFAAASAGVASAIYGMKNQCVSSAEGDNLGADASFWTHPSLVSLVPAVKELRELIQAWNADGTTKWQQRDVYLSLLEWIAGTVQSFKEAEMDKYKEMKPPEDKKSATEACAAAKAHIAAATIGLFGSIAKGVACHLGEFKLPQSSAVRTFAGGGAYTPPTSAPTQPAVVGGPEPSVSSHHSVIPPEPSESVSPVDPVSPYDITETSRHSFSRDIIPPYPPGLYFPPPGLPAPVPVDDDGPVDESDIVPVVDVSAPVVTPVVGMTPCNHRGGVEYDICFGLAKRNDGENCFDQCCRSTNYPRWQSIHNKAWCTGVTIRRHVSPDDMHRNDAYMARGARSLKRLQSLEALEEKKLERRQTLAKLELD